VLRAGMRLEYVMPATVEPPVSPAVRVLHEDDALVVLHKPAPLPMHPCGRFNRNTLQHFLEKLYTQLRVRPAHRLDANTSGLVVCAKTRAIARRLQPQFEQGRVRKVYLAAVLGEPSADEFECDASISREPSAVGARFVTADGLTARTSFRVHERRTDGTTVLEVRPRTGRTNQIRVHLHHLGLPIIGDPLYRPDGAMGSSQTLTPSDPPMCLHALELGFEHPADARPVHFVAPPPDWA